MFNIAKAQKIYIAVGYSDLRRGIDGFASIIQNTFHMNPQTNVHIPSSKHHLHGSNAPA